MGQHFGQNFHPGLGHVVAGVSGGCGDPLFRPGVDHNGRPIRCNHAGQEGLHAIQHPEKIDRNHIAPGLRVVPTAAGTGNTGVVHQHGHITCAKGGIGKCFDGLRITYIRGHGVNLGPALHQFLDLRLGGVQRIARQIRQHDAQSGAREMRRGSEPDATCPASHNGQAPGFDSIQIHDLSSSA